MATQVSGRLAMGRATRQRHWVVVFAVSLAVVTYIDRVCIGQFAPAISKDLGLDSVRMGWAFTAFGIAYAAFEIPGGFLGDWLGPRRVLMRVVLWWSFFTAATGQVWNLASLLITRFLFGAGEAGCFPNLTKAFTTWLPPAERTRAQGITWLSARWGGAFTPPLVTAVMGWVGWRHAFEIFGGLGLIWAVLFYRWFRDDPMANPKLNTAERELLHHSSRLAAGHSDVPWGRLLTSRQVWMLCWQYFCLSWGWYFFITWLPTYLREGRGLNVTVAAWLAVLPLLLGGLGNPAGILIGRLVFRRVQNVAVMRRVVATIGFTGASGFLIFSTTVNNPVKAMLCIALASFFNDLVMPGAWSSAMDVGGRNAGTVSGAMNMWGNVGGALSPLAIGYILKLTSNNWNITFYLSGAIYLLGIVFWMLLDPVTPLEDPDAHAH